MEKKQNLLLKEQRNIWIKIFNDIQTQIYTWKGSLGN